jgi:hypothetical protein
MTLQHDAVADLFGLAGTFPRPGWVVLDAARDHRFTGELVFDTAPAAHVYLERGVIYLAERASDPSLGARLVDAGALSAVQLERGAVRIGEIEHLGRLFERVPLLDRHTVLVTAEIMTEECLGWLAVQRVADVTSAPYRHHESGMHQWSRGSARPDLVPGDPLPAPTPDEAPVLAVPAPLDRSIGDRTEEFLDGLIEWDEPSWLDGSELERALVEPRADDDLDADLRPDERSGSDIDAWSTAIDPTDATPIGGDESTDWVDRLELDGLPDDDPLLPPKSLPRLPIEPADRFELVWPSGEVDEEFGAVESVVGQGHDPDADRIGATARLSRPAPPASPEPSAPVDGSAVDGDTTPADDDATDEVVLAVRRAVASIDVGSLAARQRLVDTNSDLGTGSRGTEGGDDSVGVPAPGRVAVRSGRNDWSRRTVTRSVFDEPIAEPPAPEPVQTGAATLHAEQRAGALRRLISSLRR